MKQSVILKLFMVATAAMLCLSCVSKKDQYVNKYTAFAEDVIVNGESFSALDWSAVVSQFKLLHDQYALYFADMTQLEREKVNMLDQKVAELISLHYLTESEIDDIDVADEVQEAVGIAVDVVGGVLKGFVGAIGELVDSLPE